MRAGRPRVLCAAAGTGRSCRRIDARFDPAGRLTLSCRLPKLQARSSSSSVRKGGCGVTTIAANFAISVFTETSQSTLLIDLGQPLGDAGLNLGMIANYSTANALREYSRLDGSFLNTLITKHETGLSVLAAPSEFPKDQPPYRSFRQADCNSAAELPLRRRRPWIAD